MYLSKDSLISKWQDKARRQTLSVANWLILSKYKTKENMCMCNTKHKRNKSFLFHAKLLYPVKLFISKQLNRWDSDETKWAPTFSVFWLLMCSRKFSSCSGVGTESGAMPYGMEHRMSHRSWSCSSRTFSCCMRLVFSFIRASTWVRMFFSCWSIVMPLSSWTNRGQNNQLTLQDDSQSNH